MQTLDPTFAIESFFERLRSEPQRRLLFLDFDGTLAPFTPERNEAAPYPGVRETLARIQRGGQTRVVVVSGRSVRQLPELLRLEQLPELWGSHGWERLMPNGEYWQGEAGPRAAVIRTASEAAERRGLQQHLEVKPLSVALHWRSVPPERSSAIQAMAKEWKAAAERSGLDFHAFDGGVELRLEGRNKGDAVRSVLQDATEPGPVAYLGDDLTDEEAFEALAGQGLSVLVRDTLRETRAQLWLQPPRELLEFLEAWI